MILIMVVGISDFVYVDECGVHNYYQRDWGRTKRGVRIHGTKPEKSWANMKRWLVDNLCRFVSVELAIMSYFNC